MQQLASKKPRLWAKVFGVVLAIVVAMVSLALIAITQEPKHADSSPGLAAAALPAPIADAKSEVEISFRGKSFSSLMRPINHALHWGNNQYRGERRATCRKR